ncbi:hypothetical protein SEPL_367 [Salmonella phage SE_PL]|nr:hypothetical protein CPT_Munch_055 [Salmonella phage Munch]QCW18729.1 hypothetical protein 7t3_0208 [Salmonella phage 7t3]QIG62980.1 hypothetical protein SEPL_367 [Salmonella phage SE_PL]
MASYDDDLQYAKDILRIRQALYDGTLVSGESSIITSSQTVTMHDITYEIDTITQQKLANHNGFNYYIHLAKHKEDRHRHVFGHIREETTDAASVLTSKFIRLITSKPQMLLGDVMSALLGKGVEMDLSEDYTEERHFQDSLLYSIEQVKGIVVAHYLYKHPLPEYNCFKIFFHHIPTILKILDEKEK